MKFKIVKHKGIGNWFVYKRYFFFFWNQENVFMNLSEALKYVGSHHCKIIDEQKIL